MREDELERFDVDTTKEDPFSLFSEWLKTAEQAALPQPEAMTLATSDLKGRPSARIVLLKSHCREGFVFYTNYDSNKAEDLDRNSQAELLFFWSALARQVRIHGRIEKLDIETSTTYFHSRPRGSQISAWASPQSREIESREALLERRDKVEKQFEGKEVLLPPFWGGFRLLPESFEFWQGRSNRFHDRVVFEVEEDTKVWKHHRLAP